jgi:hypothetical protein
VLVEECAALSLPCHKDEPCGFQVPRPSLLNDGNKTPGDRREGPQICHLVIIGEPGISGSIVSGYGRDDRAIEVRSPAEAKG